VTSEVAAAPPGTASLAPAATGAAATTASAPVGGNWAQTIVELGLSGRVKELAAQCVFLGLSDNVFRLALAPAYSNLRSTNAEARLEQALQARYGRQVRLRLSLQQVDSVETPAQARSRGEVEREQAALRAIESDPNVAALRENFGAVVESVAPREQS
jgi:DNA polymerase-3 subunit gamma/tau